MSSKLVVRAVFDHEKVAFNKENEVHMDVVFHAPEKADSKRTPLHMVLALDYSGSMAGSKVRSMRDTVNKLIDNLTENDTMTVIGFSDDCWEIIPVTPMDSSGKVNAKNAIADTHTRSLTNMSEALKWAFERAVSSDKKKIVRIVFLTDGLPTSGLTSHEELVTIVSQLRSDVSLSTFGFGHDYDPELLLSMSNKGRGNHFYIQNEDDCKRAFAMELGGLLSMALQDLKVEVTPSGNVELVDFLSKISYEESAGYRGITDGKVLFTLEDVFYGESKHVLFKIKLPSASQAVTARATKVCDIRVDYLDVETKERSVLEAKAKIRYVKPDDVSTEVNKDVTAQLLLIEAQKIHKEAKKLADNGQLEQAREVYTTGLVLAENNAWFENSSALKGSFQTMIENSTNAAVYSISGAKLAGSYGYTMAKARASSCCGMSLSYNSSAQESMMRSFGVQAPKEDDEPVQDSTGG